MHRGLGRHHGSQPCQPSALSTLGPGPLHHRRSTAPPHTPDKVTNIPCLLSPSTPVSRPSHPPARRSAVWLAQRTKLGLCSQPRVIFACCLATAGPRQHRTSASPEQSCAAASVRDPPSPIHSTLPGNTTTSSTSPDQETQFRATLTMKVRPTLLSLVRAHPLGQLPGGPVMSLRALRIRGPR